MHEPGGHGGDDQRPTGPPDPGRTWVHPSELGMANRNRTDRRRGTWLGAGLVVAGVGLLAVCVAMGLGSSHPASVAESSTEDTMAATLVSLTVVSGNERRAVTGVVIDQDGHVAVRAGALDGADEVWASCSGDQPQQVHVVARDSRDDVAVIAMAEGKGRPALPDESVVDGEQVLVARAGVGEAPPTVESGHISAVSNWRDGARVLKVQVPSRSTGSTSTTASPATASTDTAPTHTAPTDIATTATASTAIKAVADHVDGTLDGAAFDRRGRFVGLVVKARGEVAEVLPASAVLAVSQQLTR